MIEWRMKQLLALANRYGHSFLCPWHALHMRDDVRRSAWAAVKAMTSQAQPARWGVSSRDMQWQTSSWAARIGGFLSPAKMKAREELLFPCEPIGAAFETITRVPIDGDL